jgi:hypothetical protein
MYFSQKIIKLNQYVEEMRHEASTASSIFLLLWRVMQPRHIAGA